MAQVCVGVVNIGVRLRTILAASTVFGLIALGCGGGSGAGSPSLSSRPPVALPPTCNTSVRAQILPKSEIIAGGQTGIIVPESTIEHQSDIGSRFHTNLLISQKSVRAFESGPTGLTPVQVATAYGVPTQNSTGIGAIAIIDAYNYPTALNDFNAFSTTFGLPTESSTNPTSSSNPVFQVVYAAGYAPGNDGSWSQEMATDIEWAHALAPAAKIYLVEAASSGVADIMTAVTVAKTLPGVRQVSTSFGGTETGCNYVQYDNLFLQPGVSFFAAAGDVAGSRSYPALSNNVVAVGGTTLNVGPTGSYISESVWNGTGCGPSAFEPRPVFQDTFYSKIGLYRGGCDIAADADPNTGVSVYDSFPYQGFSGWFVAGGTSVSCPIVAAIVNGSGISIYSTQALNKVLYSIAGSQSFHPITSGSSGGFAAGTPWCFPTGLGTPNGLGAAIAAN